MDQKAERTQNPTLEIWQRLFKNKLAVISLVILAIFVLLALFADVFFNYQTMVISQDIPNRLLPPGPGHLFGTDQYGRDLLARIIHGTRYSLSIGLIAVSLAVLGGCILGGISGYYSGVTDNIIMRLVDIMLSIPPILLCISIVAALGPGMVNLMIALVIANIPGFTRLVRASVLTVKDMEYVEAARAIGLHDSRIIFKYVLLNCMGPILVNATMGIAGTILTAAGLSFIGLGVQPPAPEWGAMLSGGRQYLRAAPHILFFPGAAIVIAVLCINFIGDGLRDALDPKLKD